ncbi:MAG: hypothetical protein M1365_11315 [Actinobacteria bacterium]|nr:hypothetical protein [Actinomycetota bacterium]
MLFFFQHQHVRFDIFFTIYKDLLVARVAKEINPSILTVAVGTHVMALPQDTFNESPFLDVIIYSGEWEQTALNIVKNISNLKEAKGIFWRKLDGGSINRIFIPILTF